MIFPVALAVAKVNGSAIYDWMGSLATYGFITVYALIAIALPFHLRRSQRLTLGTTLLAGAVVATMALILEGTLYPVAEFPKNRLPYIYLLYLVAAVGWHQWQTRKEDALPSSDAALEGGE